MTLIVEAISKNKDLKSFIDFPHSLYADEKNYVPELFVAQQDIIFKKKNPFFKHSEAQLFLAKRDGKIVGRIAAVKNNNYNEYHNSNVGFFGFFDVIDDKEVSKSLLDYAIAWLKVFGFEQVIGPTNFTTNDTAALLVEGFDSPPVIMMPYNFPYYKAHLEDYGFTKEMDLLAYKIPTSTVSKRSIKMTSLLEERLGRKNIKVRNLNKKNFKNEVDKIVEIYNQAWEKNWGFVPSNQEESDHMAAGLKMVVNPDFVFLAEDGDKPIGMLLALPNINEATINIKKGRLLPFGFIKLLTGIKKVKIVRVITMGVIESYRGMGIEGLLYARVIQAAKDNGIEFGEASWILENNEMMNKGIEKLNGELYKRYRLFKLPLQ